MPPQIEWTEVVREFREGGLVFFGKRTFALDSSIDVESERARAALLALIPVRDEPPGGYARIALSLYPTGYDRHPVRERTDFDPRRAVLRAELVTKIGEPESDHDTVEAVVAWDEAGVPSLVRAATRQGAATRERVRKAALGPLRERLEAARATAFPSAVLAWRARGGAEVRLKARQALGALAEVAHRAAPAQADALRGLADAVVRDPGARLEIADDASAPPGEGDWLGLLLGRKRTLGKSVIAFTCPACGGAEQSGTSLAERPYDRRGEPFGTAGIAIACPAGHELAQAIEEETGR